jgi:hypothetical protein
MLLHTLLKNEKMAHEIGITMDVSKNVVLGSNARLDFAEQVNTTFAISERRLKGRAQLWQVERTYVSPARSLELHKSPCPMGGPWVIKMFVPLGIVRH